MTSIGTATIPSRRSSRRGDADAQVARFREEHATAKHHRNTRPTRHNNSPQTVTLITNRHIHAQNETPATHSRVGGFVTSPSRSGSAPQSK